MGKTCQIVNLGPTEFPLKEADNSDELLKRMLGNYDTLPAKIRYQ